LIKVTTIRAPEHPRGCPNETAPPLTFTLSLSKFWHWPIQRLKMLR
jgi:hypothetical protein